MRIICGILTENKKNMEYECSLDDASQRKAKEELNEKPEERLAVIQELKDWVKRQPHISSPTDAVFLLSFLRSRKFRTHDAPAMLERYWKARCKCHDWHKGLDPADPNNLAVYRDNPTYIPLPGRDKEGRKVVIARFGKIDNSGKSYTKEQWLRSTLPLFDAMIYDESIQVNGVVFLMDFSGMSLKTQSFIGLKNIKKQIDITNKAFPCRIKKLIFLKTGHVFSVLFALARPFLSEKLRSRIVVHKHLPTVYKDVEMEMLPDEYLPQDYTGPRVGSAKDCIEQYLQEYILKPEKLAFLRDLYNGPYGITTKGHHGSQHRSNSNHSEQVQTFFDSNPGQSGTPTTDSARVSLHNPPQRTDQGDLLIEVHNGTCQELSASECEHQSPEVDLLNGQRTNTEEVHVDESQPQSRMQQPPPSRPPPPRPACPPVQQNNQEVSNRQNNAQEPLISM